MRTLVLGGTGMLGRAVVLEGRRRGSAVLGLSRAQADIADPARLAYWLDVFAPEVVINCAAFTRVDDCERARDHAMAINGDAVAGVLAQARVASARLVHISSDYVFAGDQGRPYREDDATGPRSVYGQSKLAGEAAALADPSSLVVRASWLFGPGGPSFVRTMVDLIARGQVPLRVVDDQIGAPTYTPFLARALFDLASAGTTGMVHYRNRPSVSWHGFAAAIADQVAPGTVVVPVSTESFPRPAPRPAYSVLDTGRAESLLGRRIEPWLAGLYCELKTLPLLQARPGGN